MNDMTAETPGVFRFDDIRVDTSAHRLLRGGRELSIEPKAYAVLVALLRRAGRVVGKDELLDDVWGHRHVTPGVLTRVIAQIRQAIGDHPDAPRYIQTVHTLGYRFIGTLAEADTPAPARERRDLSTRMPQATNPAVPAGSDREAAAKDSCTLGRRYWYERSPASLAIGLRHFREAVAADPGNARAWCGIADSHLLLYEYGDLPIDQAMREARAAIGSAHGLQAELGEAYASQGLLELELRHYPLAISLLEQAVQLDPGLSHARGWHAMALSLDGRLAEAETMVTDALERDPGNIVLLTTMSLNLAMQGRWESAEQVLAAVRHSHPAFLEAHWQLAWSRAQHGRLAAAYLALRGADAEAGASRWTDRHLAHVALMCGLPELAELTVDPLPAGRDLRLWTILVETRWAQSRWNEAVDLLEALHVEPMDRTRHAALMAHALAHVGRRSEALTQYELAYPGDPASGESAMRPWDVGFGLGERANHVSLLGVDHPRRPAMLAGLRAQLAHLRQGGVRLPSLDYHSAVVSALEGDDEQSLRWLDRALDAGFADALAFRRELVWSGFVSSDALASRQERMERKLVGERFRIQAAENPA